MSNEIEVFGWVRLSPDEVQKGDVQTSVKNQIDLIQTEAPKKNRIVKEIFYNQNKKGDFQNISGSERSIPKFMEMVERAKKGEVKEIWTKSSDRFVRDIAHGLDTLKDLLAYGVQVYSIVENKFLDPTDIGDSVRMILNEQTIIKGRKDAELLVKQYSDKGLPTVPAPFGYKYVVKHKGMPNQQSEWVIKEKEAEIVANLFKLILDGYRPTKIIQELDINPSKFYRIVRNRSYYGMVHFKKKIKDANKNIIREEDIIYKGIHGPIISQEQWEKAQMLLKA